ncbi:MAG TPA: hypothetical protein VL551_10880 [Actinospica sp.]|jgi:hypothetical protein|nr:hypothetical protein [Actinospica sp.]
MSDRFDDLLSGVVDTATDAAREPGAAAARKRGRQRRNHKRLAASTLSVVLLGAIGGVAAVSVHNTNGVPAAHVTGTAVATSAPATPSPTVTVTSSPSSTPTTGASSPSSTAGSTTATSGASTTVVNPAQYVANAWLNASQMPLALPGYTDWQLNSNVNGTRIGGEVFANPVSQSPTWCMDMGMGGLSGLSDGLKGSQIEMFSGSNRDKIRTDGIIPADTFQSALFYQNAADAEAAMNGLAADFATCKNQVTALDPTTGTNLVGSIEQTANQTDAQCWSVLAVPATHANPGTLDHDCFVSSGSIVELVNIEVNEDSSFNTQSFTATDTALIPELRQALQAYQN